MPFFNQYISAAQPIAEKIKKGGRPDEHDPVLLQREPGAHDSADRNEERLLKKGRQAARLVRTGHDRHDLMAAAMEHFAHGDGLGHVAPAFPLYCEHYFHGI